MAATPSPPQRPGRARAAHAARAQALALVAQAGSAGVTRAAIVHAAQRAGGTVDGALPVLRQRGALRRLDLGRYVAVEEREERSGMLLALAVGASAALVVPTVLAALVLSGGQMR